MSLLLCVVAASNSVYVICILKYQLRRTQRLQRSQCYQYTLHLSFRNTACVKSLQNVLSTLFSEIQIQMILPCPAAKLSVKAASSEGLKP